MTDIETIREYAQIRAQECIDDWAMEGWYESNDTWGTDFSEAELRQIAELAAKAVAVIPEDAK